MTEDKYIPSRFKQANVERFKPIMDQVVAGLPEIRFSHDALGLNHNTAMNRVRDAMSSVIKGIAYFNDFPVNVLSENWPLYNVGYDQLTREVVLKQVHAKVVELPRNIVEITLRSEEPDFEEALEHLRVLFMMGLLRGKITVLGPMDDQLIHHLVSYPNIYYKQVGPNEHIIL